MDTIKRHCMSHRWIALDTIKRHCMSHRCIALDGYNKEELYVS